MEEKRRQHQKELAVMMNDAAKERLALLKGKKEDQKVRKSTISYRSANLLPKEPEIMELKIFVGNYCFIFVQPVVHIQVCMCMMVFLVL